MLGGAWWDNGGGLDAVEEAEAEVMLLLSFR